MEAYPGDNNGKTLLQPADICEPLSPNVLVDASAILFAAGHEAKPKEITAFAYYHRAKLKELVEHPGVDSGMMLNQLFHQLPEQISQDNLLGRLAIELSFLHQEKTIEPIAAVSDSKAPVLVPHANIVSAAVTNSAQLQLFEPRSMSLNADPSPELIKKAEALQKYKQNLFKIAGFGIRLYSSQEPGLKKKSLLPVAILNFAAVFLPIALKDGFFGNWKYRRFEKQLQKEYPHLTKLNYGLWVHSNLKGGKTDDYLQSVLALRQRDQQQIAANQSQGNEPPDDSGNGIKRDTGCHTRQAASQKGLLNPILADI